MLKATKLPKSVLPSSETHGILRHCKIYNLPNRQFKDQQGCLCHSRDKVVTLNPLRCDLCSEDSCFCLHYSWNNTLDILPIAREAIIDSYFLCLLSHNNKLVLVLYKNEWILFLSKNFILTILWDNQRKRRPILINKEYIYLIFPPTSPHSNNHM